MYHGLIFGIGVFSCCMWLWNPSCIRHILLSYNDFSLLKYPQDVPHTSIRAYEHVLRLTLVGQRCQLVQMPQSVIQTHKPVCLPQGWGSMSEPVADFQNVIDGCHIPVYICKTNNTLKWEYTQDVQRNSTTQHHVIIIAY